jgi:hypothetical protein
MTVDGYREVHRDLSDMMGKYVVLVPSEGMLMVGRVAEVNEPEGIHGEGSVRLFPGRVTSKGPEDFDTLEQIAAAVRTKRAGVENVKASWGEVTTALKGVTVYNPTNTLTGEQAAEVALKAEAYHPTDVRTLLEAYKLSPQECVYFFGESEYDGGKVDILDDIIPVLVEGGEVLHGKQVGIILASFVHDDNLDALERAYIAVCNEGAYEPAVAAYLVKESDKVDVDMAAKLLEGQNFGEQEIAKFRVLMGTNYDPETITLRD